MEFGLERSPYNFDIQMRLLKLYDALNLSPSFNQAMIALNLKGVQLESMGFLHFRHILATGELSLFKSFMVKYNKYSKLNMQNLKTCKAQALKDNNYDQIENFIEYEDFINNSYFNMLTKFLGYLVDFHENSGSQQDFAKSFFTNMKDQIV